ncbi:phage antirepressor KilAC domain-containing protein [Burkholderia ubonensis]|uniref:phage antirepressor KilAC domain-containing protein n=1 Tax=Burkholderia ubonensis TaxID=101571 RepID=UPI000BA7AAF7|nr:hypothetical protein CJO70_31795 [Burkholderia ubonensis]PAK04386.1 hypothetical protein CJO67_30670 [Burkholderia ubonensis]RQP33147.1 hypothetical protein DF155_17890 [Burkholderia ubonensis]RQP36687.1 hypothetical protein DF154_20890 [Burkholderia ubonensis]RQP37010.1 hypothetical protein DF156_21930 [Burkholderia ubonensis]
MKKIAGKRNLEKQAERLAESLRRAGEPEAEVQRRVQRVLESARSGGAKRRRARRRTEREAVNPFAGCRSVTDVARDLRMRRFGLFEWLSREGLLYRASDGWRATDDALAAGWAVMRGARAVRWVQLTAAGAEEIARRIDIAPGGRSRG